MSANLALALSDLRAFADAKLSALDELGNEHSKWLSTALRALHETRLRETGPSSEPAAQASKRPRGRPPRPTRSTRSKPAATEEGPLVHALAPAPDAELGAEHQSRSEPGDHSAIPDQGPEPIVSVEPVPAGLRRSTRRSVVAGERAPAPSAETFSAPPTTRRSTRSRSVPDAHPEESDVSVASRSGARHATQSQRSSRGAPMAAVDAPADGAPDNCADEEVRDGEAPKKRKTSAALRARVPPSQTKRGRSRGHVEDAVQSEGTEHLDGAPGPVPDARDPIDGVGRDAPATASESPVEHASEARNELTDPGVQSSMRRSSVAGASAAEHVAVSLDVSGGGDVGVLKEHPVPGAGLSHTLLSSSPPPALPEEKIVPEALPPRSDSPAGGAPQRPRSLGGLLAVEREPDARIPAQHKASTIVPATAAAGGNAGCETSAAEGQETTSGLDGKEAHELDECAGRHHDPSAVIQDEAQPHGTAENDRPSPPNFPAVACGGAELDRPDADGTDKHAGEASATVSQVGVVAGTASSPSVDDDDDHHHRHNDGEEFEAQASLDCVSPSRRIEASAPSPAHETSEPSPAKGARLSSPAPVAAAPPVRSIASNLVSAVRSLLPLGSSTGVHSLLASKSAAATGGPAAAARPPARVAALEKAEAARRAQEAREAERERRRLELDRLRAERATGKAAQGEADAARSRAEQAERRQREAAARRQLLQSERAAAAAAAGAKKPPAQSAVSSSREHGAAGGHARGGGETSAAVDILENGGAAAPGGGSKPLKRIQYLGQQHASGEAPKLRLVRQLPGGAAAEQAEATAARGDTSTGDENGAPAEGATSEPEAERLLPRMALNPLADNACRPGSGTSAKPLAGGPVRPLVGAPAPISHKDVAAATSPDGPRPRSSSHGSQPQYEMSPYRSDEDSSGDDGPQKPVPEWARGRQLQEQLLLQVHIDPDQIFQQQHRTCSLDEVFAKPKNGQRDFSRRTSTGNWTEDRLTWQEEMRYKKAMGFV